MIHIFIINSYAGYDMFADTLRKKLEHRTDLRYFIFSTRNAGNETELVQKILRFFPDEKLRFYCCGGSGTMRNMLCGFENFQNVETAFFPRGITNDFLKVFGKEAKRFSDIDELINGDVVLVDYIKTNHGISLNTLSVGIDSYMKLEERRFNGMLGKKAPYVLALLSGLFSFRPQEYIVHVDDQVYEGKISEVLFANGGTVGGYLVFDQEPNVFDGLGSYCLGPDVWGLKALPIIRTLVKGNREKLAKFMRLGQCRTMTVERKDKKPFSVNFDGEMVGEDIRWQISIVKRGLPFVVPKGVIKYE